MDERSRREKQKLEREQRAHERAEKQLRWELQMRNQQLQRLRQNLEREIAEQSDDNGQIQLDLDQEPEIELGIEDTEEDRLIDDREPEEILQEDRKMDFAGGFALQSDEKDSRHGNLTQYDIEDEGDYRFSEIQSLRSIRENALDTEIVEDTTRRKKIVEKNIETDQGEDYIQQLRRRLSFDEEPVSYKLPHPTPTFLKRGDSLSDAPKSILKKKSSTPIYLRQSNVREKYVLGEDRQSKDFSPDSQRARNKEGDPTEHLVKKEDGIQDRMGQAGVTESGNYNETIEEKMLEKIRSLHLQTERMAEKSRQRLSEEDGLRERIKLLEQKKKEVIEEKKRQKNLSLIKQEEERLEKILRQRMEEEVLQKRKLAKLYKQEEEMRKEIEREDREENLLLEVKQEAESEQQKQIYNEDERRRMTEYIKELESRLMERNETANVTDRLARAAQDEEIKRKDLYMKDRLKLETEFEEIDQYRAILSVRENEIQQKEKSLKQLEVELQRKENDLKLKYSTQLPTEVIRHDETTEKITKEDRKESATEPIIKTEVTHFVKPFVNGFSGADPIPKNERSFEEWKLETQYLINSKVYPEYIINQAIRNSLRGQARKVLVTLGPKATSSEIRQKIECLFGNVASGESVLQEFYNAMQRSNESVPAWGIRIEEIFQKAKEKGHVTDTQRDKMLKNKFWRGLKNSELKNASRIHFEKEKVDFELLRTKVRTIELEMT